MILVLSFFETDSYFKLGILGILSMFAVLMAIHLLIHGNYEITSLVLTLIHGETLISFSRSMSSDLITYCAAISIYFTPMQGWPLTTV